MTAQHVTHLPVTPTTRVRVLGPLEVPGVEVPTANLVRTLFVLLAVHPGVAWPVEKISRELWPDPPPAWKQVVQTYVLRLRKPSCVDRDGIVTEHGCYRMTRFSADDVDALRLCRLVDDAQRAFDHDRLHVAEDLLLAALSMSRGDPLAGIRLGTVLGECAARFTDRVRSARWMLREIGLRLGRHRELLDDLQSAWRLDKTFEPAATQLMTALYRCGLRPAALEVFRATRVALVEEYGVDPVPATVRLHQQVLSGDPALDLPGGGL